MWHGYVGIEDLGLTANQRQTLITALRQLGPASDPQPCRLNHWRHRLDDLAVIFEALFNDNDWTVATIKARLGSIFGFDPALISHDTTSSVYGPVVVFKYPASTSRLRMITFAGISSGWEASRQAATQYIKDNRAAWDAPPLR